MITLEDIIQDFVDVGEYHRLQPERFFPDDDYSDEVLYERKETIENPQIT